MEIYVWNKDREKIGVIDAFESLVWTDRYIDVGDFELILTPTLPILQLLQPNNYISISQKYSHKWMIVERIQLTTDIEAGDRLKVSGRSLEALQTRRYIVGNCSSGGASRVQACIDIIHFTCWENSLGSWPERYSPYMKYEWNYDSRLDAFMRGGTFWFREKTWETITSLCNEFGVGFRTEFDPDTLDFVSTIYLGQDRSYDQTDNPRVIFSREFNNLLRTEYIYTDVPMRNYFDVAGPTEPWFQLHDYGYGDPSDTSTGIDLRDQLIDASHINRYDPYGDPLDPVDYRALLELERYRQAYLWQPYSFFQGEAATVVTSQGIEGVFKLNEDYFLGDRVQFEDPYGISGSALVSEITITEDLEGLRIIPTFEF